MDYTRGFYTELPATDADLSSPYSEQDMLDIATVDTSRVSQTASDSYAIHQYKNYTTLTKLTLRWVGQSNIAPNHSTVYLQVYKVSTTSWETLATETLANADVDFTLTASITDTTNYINPSGMITARVYQQAV